MKHSTIYFSASKRDNIPANVLIIIAAITFIIPVAGTIVLSFIHEGGISLRGYDELLFNYFSFYPMFWNSILYAVIIIIIQLTIIVPCAFGFIYARFPCKRILFVLYIMLMMMPLQVTILPNYIGLRDFGLINTRWAIIIPAVFSPFGVVIMRQYMLGIDSSVIEAMRLDTNSMFIIITQAVISQIKICIFAVALFVFADCWNMLEQPLLFLNNEYLKTLSVFISNIDASSSIVLFPAAVLFIIPAVLLFGLFNENLEKGLIFSNLK